VAGGRSSRSAPDCAPRQTYRPGREVQIFLNNKSSKNTKGHTSRTRSKKSKGKSVAAGIGKGILTVMLVAIIFCCVVAGVMTLYVVNFVKPYNISLNESDLKSTSIIYAKDSASNSQTALAEISGSENRIWVSLSGTPKNLRNAIISTEDMRFNEHEGVDFRRTVYSFANMIFHFNKTNQGGSTITQQLIKNIQGNISERTPAVKLREIITAVDVEKKYSKDQILEAYMNIIPLGNSCYGVQTASNMYFGKDVKDIDLAQAALLAGIIQAPESYEPYKHMTQAQVRQKYVLKNMLTQKMITNAEYTAAINEKITLTAKKTTVRGWFVDQVIRDVIADLQTQKGYSAAVAENYVYTGGLRIYTTEDISPSRPTLDSQSTPPTPTSYFKAWDGSKYQSSMLHLRLYTGKVLGLVGGTGAKTEQYGAQPFATMSYRPAGSSFKPICTYALAIEKGRRQLVHAHRARFAQRERQRLAVAQGRRAVDQRQHDDRHGAHPVAQRRRRARVQARRRNSAASISSPRSSASASRSRRTSTRAATPTPTASA
jgi:penicillin-binding protein 1A